MSTQRLAWQPASGAVLTHGVLICSYKRADMLKQCLDAIAAQSRPPDDIIVVARSTDEATIRLVTEYSRHMQALRLITLSQAGKVAAQNVGLDACRTDILTITDDDTRAGEGWLKRISDHFTNDASVGGVGGRDRVFDGQAFDDRRHPVVGHLSWFGRTRGNHHIGYGPARKVHFIKGANMSYRAVAFAALRFDRRLRGNGAQAHDDLGFSLAVGRSGWKLIYDPEVLVEHYPAVRQEPRHYVASSQLLDPGGYYDTAFNNVLALWDKLTPARRLAYAVWSVLIGMRTRPGLLQSIRLTPGQGRTAWRRFLICQQALFDAYVMLLTTGNAESHRSAVGAHAP